MKAEGYRLPSPQPDISVVLIWASHTALPVSLKGEARWMVCTHTVRAQSARAWSPSAQCLYLSLRTVEMYVSNVLAKLNAATRAEAAHKAHEQRLLST